MLDHDRLLRFHRDGYLGPLPLAASILTPAALRALDGIVHSTRPRHLDSRLVFELCTDPAVVEAVNAILGADLLLWNSSFWTGEGPTPWHRDLHDWPTALTITAWIALTDAPKGCLEVVPGSHRKLLPPPVGLDEAAGRPIPLPAGHFAVLSDRVLHRCKPSVTSTSRWALAARFTTPGIHVPGHRCILVSGSDRFGINKIGPPPARHTRLAVVW